MDYIYSSIFLCLAIDSLYLRYIGGPIFQKYYQKYSRWKIKTE